MAAMPLPLANSPPTRSSAIQSFHQSSAHVLRVDETAITGRNLGDVKGVCLYAARTEVRLQNLD